MTALPKSFTADELLRMPDDGFRYELVKGDLRKMAPASHQHGRITMNMGGPFGQHVRANALGTVYAAGTGFLIATDPDTVRAPDVAFVSQERVERLGDATGFWPGPPDLAVEVVSPSDIYAEVEEKVFDWLNAGTRLVIVANPRKRTVTAYRSLTDIVILTEKDVLDGDDVVPGWRIAVEDIFT